MLERQRATIAEEARQPGSSDFDDLGVADADLLGPPLLRAAQIADRLLERGVHGLRLLAPSFVAMDRTTRLPIVIAQVAFARELPRLRVEDRGVLIASNLGQGFVRAARVVSGDLPNERPQGPPPLGFEGGLGPDESPMRGALVVALDVEHCVGARAGSYLLTLLLADRASNRARVTLGASPRTHDEEASALAQELSAQQRPRSIAPPPGEPGMLPRYERLDASPAVPSGVGLALSIDRAAKLRPGARCVLFGAFRLPGAPSPEATSSAVASITLVITGSDDPTPCVIALSVPTTATIDPSAGAETRVGHFALDLFEMPQTPRLAQTCFIYAFSGELMTGPAVVALVSGDL